MSYQAINNTRVYNYMKLSVNHTMITLRILSGIRGTGQGWSRYK